MKLNLDDNFKVPFVLEAKYMQTIGDCAKAMAEEANKRNQEVTTNFNGASLVCRPGDAPELVEQQYTDWQNKPLTDIEKKERDEWLKQHAESEAKQREILDSLITELKEKRVDFSSDQKTAIWLRKLFENTGDDYHRVKEIIPLLNSYGYSSDNIPGQNENVTLKEKFMSIEDKDEAYRTLVNLAIFNIKDSWLSPYFIAMDIVTKKFPEN